MQKRTFGIGLITAFVFGTIAVAPALADKPEHAGSGKGRSQQEQHEKALGERRGDPLEREPRYQRSGDRPRHESGRDDRRDRTDRDDRRPSTVIIHHFNDHRRSVAGDYYHRHYSSGRCPPGLARKHNGCVPPGLARKWSRGRPLPRDVIFHDLPPALVIELGAPPPHHRYVRVASDILLIAIGTGMVVDAIEDLGRR